MAFAINAHYYNHYRRARCAHGHGKKKIAMKIAAAAASINAHSYGSGIICPSQSNYSPEVQLRLVVAAAAAVLGVALLGRRDLRLVVRDVIFCRLGITAVVAESGEHGGGGRGGEASRIQICRAAGTWNYKNKK